jgi:hypothetical protein
MRRPRVTIAALMALVLTIAFGLAALRNADDFWASATFTVAIITIVGASLGALARNGAARMTWAGFAAFGWAYLLLSVLPPRAVGVFGFGPIPWPDLLINSAMSYLYPYLVPQGGFDEVDDQVAHSLQLILFSLVGAVVGRLVAVKGDRPDP